MATSTSLALERVKFYQNALTPLTGNGKDRLLRHWDYINISKYNQISKGGVAVAMVSASAFGCAFLGAKAGATIGNAIAKEPGMKIGTGVGFTVGFAGGIAGGTFAYVKITENYDDFKNYIDCRADDIIDNAMSKKYEDDNILKNNICPITSGIMLKPVRTPQGHLLDIEALKGLIPDQKGRVNCPYTRELFLVGSAKVDIERALLINKRIYHLTYLDIQAAVNDTNLKKNLEVHNSEIKEVIELCYNGIFDLIDKRRTDKTISFSQSQQERTDFVKLFGDSVDSELDWSLEWNDILKKRWIHFYPQIPVFDSNEV